MRRIAPLAAAIVTISSLAGAESQGSGPRCLALVAPEDGSVIPANAPALAVRMLAPSGLDGNVRSATLTGDGDVSVVVGADDVVPGATLVRLGAELLPSRAYRLDYELGCTAFGGAVEGFPAAIQSKFSAGPVSPLPTTLGA